MCPLEGVKSLKALLVVVKSVFVFSFSKSKSAKDLKKICKYKNCLNTFDLIIIYSLLCINVESDKTKQIWRVVQGEGSELRI